MVVLVALGLSGCNRGPARVGMPNFKPDRVAARALEEFDADGDGALNSEELQAAPGIAAAVPLMDADGNRQLTADEIAAELQKWRDEKAALISLSCRVTQKGRPVSGAQVRLVPEACFDDTIPDASGVSDAAGNADLSCDPEHKPETLKSYRAVKPGIYRVEVTHPSITVPPEFNSSTTIGAAVSLRNSNPLSIEL